MKAIELSEEVFASLQRLAVPFEDTPESVIKRLIENQSRIAAKPAVVDLPETKTEPRTEKMASRFVFTRPQAFRFLDLTVAASSFKDLYVRLCELLAAKDPIAFRRVLQLRGRARSFFSSSSSGMTHAEKIQGTDLYMETNFSADSVVERCYEVITALGYKSEDFEIVLRESPLRQTSTSNTKTIKERPMTWVKAIIVAMKSRGGRASLFDLYKEVPAVRGGNIPASYDAIIRGTLECHSSDSKNYRPGNPDYFRSVGGIGSGEWALRLGIS